VLFSKMRVAELFDPALKTKRAAVERHHLFPRAHLKALGIESLKDVNQIANFALMEWPDNTAISGTSPETYWPKYAPRHTDAELDQMRRWHALPAGWESMAYEDFLPARRRLMAQVIRDGFNRLKMSEDEPDRAIPVEKLIADGETDTVEFKAAARYNQHTGERDPKIEMVIVKTVAGFTNAKGGTLLIGVNDACEPIGLDHDLTLVKKGDLDGYQLFLIDLLERTIGKPATANVKVTFPAVNGHEVCRVDVAPAVSPVFVDPPGGVKQADFYVRLGNLLASSRPTRSSSIRRHAGRPSDCGDIGGRSGHAPRPGVPWTASEYRSSDCRDERRLLHG
jgi:Putative DNA-binding domain